MLGYHLLTPDDRADLLTFLSGGRELGLDDAVVAKAVELRQSRRMGLGDAIIAASALVHKLPLVTRNVADFRHIGRLEIIDPFSVS